MQASKTIIDAAIFLEETQFSKMIALCSNGTCGKSLNATISFMTNDTECNLTGILYDHSPYNEFEFIGFSDYYMQLAGYTQTLANIGITV